MADIPPYGKPRIYRLYIRCRSGQQLRNEEEAAGCSHPDSLPGAGLRGNTTGLHLAEAVCLPEKVVLTVKMEPGSVRQRGSIHFHKTDVAEFVCL